MAESSVEDLLDGNYVKEPSKCEYLHEICDEYVLSLISFYNFVSLIEVKDLIDCLDDFTFIKVVRKLAEDGLVLDVFYEIEDNFNVSYQKLVFIKFIKAVKLLLKEEKLTRKSIERLLSRFAIIEYFSKETKEEKENFLQKFLELLNVNIVEVN